MSTLKSISVTHRDSDYRVTDKRSYNIDLNSGRYYRQGLNWLWQRQTKGRSVAELMLLKIRRT